MITKREARAHRVAMLFIISVAVVLVVVVAFLGYKVLQPIFQDLSASGDVVVLPDVVGMLEQEAQNELSALGLVPRIERRLHNNEQPVENVFKQDPRAGSKTKPGRHVSLWISLGKASFIAPDLLGKQISVVPGELHEAGLVLGSVTKVYLPEVEQGAVVDQNPASGREYQTAVPINVVVADNKNLPQVPVPDVVNQRMAAAENILARANLHLAKVTYVADDSVVGSTVIEQSIPFGRSVALGSRIELKVALPTAVMESPVKTIIIRIPISVGPAKQRVKIKVFDRLNSQGSTIYEEEKRPGDSVEKRVELEGNATVYVFLRDMDTPFREDKL